jgi:hypothetical protein
MAIPSKDCPRRSTKTFICFKELPGDLKTAVDDEVTFADVNNDKSNETKTSPTAGNRAPIIVITSPPVEAPVDGCRLVRMGGSMQAKEPKSSDSTPSKLKKTE